MLNLEDMGFEVEASHHEIAPAQHEIDLQYTEGLEAADHIMTFKMAARPLPSAMDFMPLLCPNQRKESMAPVCILTCPCPTRTDTNLFADDSDELGLSQLAYPVLWQVF